MNSSTQEISKPYFTDDSGETHGLDSKTYAKDFINDFLLQYMPSDGRSDILDVGCGKGTITTALAEVLPKCHIQGIDICANQLNIADENAVGLENVTFKQGSVYELPVDHNSKDIVYTRSMIGYLKDPLQGIKELYRVCKPGGTVILQDLDGQLVTHYPHEIKGITQIMDGLAATGFDPFIGRKLYTFGLQAGFKHLRTDLRPHQQVIGKIDDINYRLWDRKINSALQQVSTIVGEEKALAFKNNFMDFLLDDTTLMYSTLFTVYLRKPAQ